MKVVVDRNVAGKAWLEIKNVKKVYAIYCINFFILPQYMV